MVKFEDNISPYLSLVEGAAPGSPAAGDFRLFFDVADHLLKWKNSAGTVVAIATGTPLLDQGVITYLDGTVAAAPGTHAAGKLRLYAKTGKVLAVKDDAGVETVLGAGGGSSPTGSITYKSGNTTLVNANQFYDAASVSLVAGTYLIFAYGTLLTVATVAAQLTAKLWDGTTVIASGEETSTDVAGLTEYNLFSLAGYVVIGSPATWKLSLASTVANHSVIEQAAPYNGAGNNACGIVALKIA